jgi:hypothetical protein
LPSFLVHAAVLAIYDFQTGVVDIF